MARIVVTGDAGFIGYHTVRKLLHQGHTVLGIDALTTYYSPSLKRDRLASLRSTSEALSASYSHLTARVEDRQVMGPTLEEFRPDVVVHLAAQAGVRYSLEAPEEYVAANVQGTQVLFEAIKDLGVEHALLASTSSAYGGNPVPFRELDRTQSPVSLYAATKLASEAIAHSYSHLWSIPTTCFRFFTVYGPWGRPDMALFKFVRAILAGEPIEVYGNGEMSRDFTYVNDLVDAVALLLTSPPVTGSPVGIADSLSPVAPFRIVNIGGGSPARLGDFIDAIESAVGMPAIRKLLPMQPGDVVDTYADTALLRELIGGAPSTPLNEGVEAFVEWYVSYHRETKSSK